MAKVVWIIGGGSGIGAAVAVRLAREGWTVVISGRRAEKLAEVATHQPSLHPLPLDVTNADAVRAAVAEVVAHHGRIDLLVFGAIAALSTPPGRYEAETFRHSFDVGYLGLIRLLEAVVPRMREQGDGQIAIIGSLAGYVGFPGASAYSSLKAALAVLAQSLHAELAPDRIDVRLILPGFVKSELTARNRGPMPMLMETDVAATRIVDGLLRSRRFAIAFPLPMLLLMRCLRALPAPLFFRAMRQLMPRRK